VSARSSWCRLQFYHQTRAFLRTKCDTSVLYAAAAPRNGRIEKDALMASTATGTIKRLTDKGFGFIAAPDGVEYFFHQSACQGTRFDDLREGQRVTFEIGQGPKGPRAENVKLA
jgi:CspA family cold shock protein